uniref:uncharacterized protein LOC131111342 n=1 Tax=Doryrhamphus excisus TaxID=161450 RepID=UPI0025ADBB1B|nr:uncharacterized protein LOC131111342 [Doryrhamphus excisus]
MLAANRSHQHIAKQRSSVSVKCCDCVEMCKVQMLRALVNQRLAAAVEEIFVVIERTIAEYEEALSITKEENEQQRQLLDALFKKSEVVLHRADVHEEHFPCEQQEWCSRVEHQEPQPLYVKKEEEDHSLSQDGEHLEGLDDFPVIWVPVKNEDDEDKSQSGEKTRAEPPSGSSTQHFTTEADGDRCGGSQADILLAPLSDSDDTTPRSPDTDEDSRTFHTDKSLLNALNVAKLLMTVVI